MSDVTWFSCIEDVAVHLGAVAQSSQARWTRADGAAPVVVHWDDARSLVRFRAPLDIDLAGIATNELALAIAQVNFGLGMLALELDGELAFTTHLFLDEHARVSSTALAAVGAAIDRCRERTTRILAAVRGAAR